MILKRLLFFFFCAVTYNMSYTNQLPANLSAEDQKMLAELDNEINTFVNSMPPEQQQQFWKDVEELSDTMSKMKPDELDNFIQGVFSGDIKELPTAQQVEPEITVPQLPNVQAPETKPVTEPSPKIEEQKITSPLQSAEIKKAIEIVEIVIDQIETFLRKIQIIPKIEGKIEQWGKQGSITGWQEGLNWNKLKSQIDELVQKLYKAKDRDPKTKEYPYIGVIAKNKSLVENLEKLGTALKMAVPTIQAPEFGQIKITKTTQVALKKTMNALNEAIFSLKIPQELEAIFSGQLTISAQKQAEEKKLIQSTKSGPLPLNPRPAIGGGSTNLYTGGDYNPTSAYNSPDVMPRAYSSAPSSYPDRASSPRSTSQVSDKNKPSAGTNPAAKESDTKKSPVDQKKPEETKKVDITTDTIADGFLEQALSNIDQVVGEFNKYSDIFKNIKQYLTQTDQSVNADMATYTLPKMIKTVRKASDKINSLRRRIGRLANEKDKKLYRESLTKSTTIQNLKTLETLASDIDSINKNINTLKDSITADKQYAYMGGRASEQASQAIKQTVPVPSSIFILQKEINTLVESAKNLEKKE
jgi:hypothetical protein